MFFAQRHVIPKALQGTEYNSHRREVAPLPVCVRLLTGPQSGSLFPPKTVDSYKARGDECASPRKNITCPHDEHHYNDDEFSGPQLGGLANLLHRHLVWGDNTHTHTRRVNKVPLRTPRFIVPERRCEIAVTPSLCGEKIKE